MWDALRLDVRHSLRSLRRAPTFSLTVIATLALAIGATMAVGSLLNAIVFRPVAVPHPRQLVALSALDQQTNGEGYFYADTFNAYRAAQRSFSQLALYSNGALTHVQTRSGASADASVETVSASYFELVGARLSAGRVFTDADDEGVVISEAFSRRIFGSGPAVGETVTLDTVPATVVGVLAAGFVGLQPDNAPDMIMSLPLRRAITGDASRPLRSRTVVGRLARGVSITTARAEALARWPSIQGATLPAGVTEGERQALGRQRLTVTSLATGFSGLRDRYANTLWLLLVLAGILLAVACANLAGLALARSLTRRHDVAIRLALGGSARRVFWQLLVDGVLLSAAAFLGAVPLAWWIVRAMTASLILARLGASKLPPVTPDARVLAATALLTVLIGLAIGVVSASQSVTGGVDDGVRGRGATRSLGRIGRSLLVAQVALSMTLLVGAGLFTTTLVRLRGNDASLQSQRIVFTRAFRQPGDAQLLPPDYYRRLVTGLAQMPGADAAALSVYYPTYFGNTGPLPIDYHYTRADGVTPLEGAVLTDYVSPGFFDLFRLARLSGRDVSWSDGPDTPGVAVLSASLARALFPAGDAVGQHIRTAGTLPRDVAIVGVVADAAYGKLDEPRPFVVFRPIMQEVARAQFPMAYVRASGDLAMVRDGYTRVVRSLGHRLLRDFFITSSDWVDRALLQERFLAGLGTFAAAITLVLACVGVYGLLAYSVAARVREIGVRMALGAERGRVLRMILRDGLGIGVPGVIIGAPCAWASARLVRAQLYGVDPGDPRLLLIAAATLLATIVAASVAPALRASRVAPLEALREE